MTQLLTLGANLSSFMVSWLLISDKRQDVSPFGSDQHCQHTKVHSKWLNPSCLNQSGLDACAGGCFIGVRLHVIKSNTGPSKTDLTSGKYGAVGTPAFPLLQACQLAILLATCDPTLPQNWHFCHWVQHCDSTNTYVLQALKTLFRSKWHIRSRQFGWGIGGCSFAL